MDQQTAVLIFAAIMSVAVAVWAFSLSKALNLGKLPTDLDSQWESEKVLPFNDGRSADERGTITREGDPDQLSKALVLSLKRSFFGQLESIYQIRRHPDGRIVLKKNGPLICNLPPALYFTDADISFERSHSNSVDVLPIGI